MAEASDSLRRQVKQLAQEIKDASEAVPSLYTLEWREIGVPSVFIVEPTEEEQSVDLDKSQLFRNFSCFISFKVCTKGQMLLGSFVGSFKKTDGYKQSNWYQKPVSEKGLSKVKALFGGIEDVFTTSMPEFAGDCANVVDTYWLFGQDPKVRWYAPTRTG